MTREDVGLRAIVADTIHPRLFQAGFRRKGSVWNRSRQDWIDVVNVQTSRAGSKGREHFTINCGVLLPEVYRLVWRKEQPRFVDEVYCIVRARVGDLLKPAAHKWWHLKTPADHDSCRAEVVRAIDELILPFLETMDSLPAVRAYLEAQQGYHKRYGLSRIYLAIAQYKDGAHQEALRGLRDMDGGWGARASVVLRALTEDECTDS